MSGMRMTLRSVYTQILDEFGRGGVLETSKTTIGQKVWTKVGSNSTVATVENGSVRSTGGSGDVPIVLNMPSANIDMSFELRELRSIPAMLTASLRVNTTTAARYDLVLRTDPLTPQYALVYLQGSTVTTIFETGLTPTAGDKIRITILDNHLKFYVNRVLISETTLTNQSTWMNHGLKFNGTDSETAVSNFGISVL